MKLEREGVATTWVGSLGDRLDGMKLRIRLEAEQTMNREASKWMRMARWSEPARDAKARARPRPRPRWKKRREEKRALAVAITRAGGCDDGAGTKQAKMASKQRWTEAVRSGAEQSWFELGLAATGLPDGSPASAEREKCVSGALAEKGRSPLLLRFRRGAMQTDRRGPAANEETTATHTLPCPASSQHTRTRMLTRTLQSPIQSDFFFFLPCFLRFGSDCKNHMHGTAAGARAVLQTARLQHHSLIPTSNWRAAGVHVLSRLPCPCLCHRLLTLAFVASDCSQRQVRQSFTRDTTSTKRASLNFNPWRPCEHNDHARLQWRSFLL
jgi:hypothetical protein